MYTGKSEKENKIEEEPRFIKTVEVLKTLVTDQSRVVEIGASDASFRKYVHFKEWITVDKYGKPDVKTDINGPVVELPFADNSVNIVICTEVLEHLTIGTPLVEEIARIMCKDGRAVISVPNIVSLQSRIKVIFGHLPGLAASGDCGPPLGGSGILVDGNWVASHVVNFNVKRLKQYLERAGLNVVKQWRMPVSLSVKNYLKLTVPSFLSPKTFSDFILVEAVKCSD
jgi:ubiquinone/menaquinone biosynthesis C-methylase UbiE